MSAYTYLKLFKVNHELLNTMNIELPFLQMIKLNQKPIYMTEPHLFQDNIIKLRHFQNLIYLCRRERNPFFSYNA